MAAQNARTRAVLDRLPSRPALHRRLTQLLRTGVSTAPAVAGDRVFTLDREGDADQARLVVRSAVDRDAVPRVVVDPHALTGDLTASLDWYHPSPDGRLVAYGVSEAGSERSVLSIVDVDTRETLPDRIPDTRAASVAWLPDGSAFAYTRYPPGADYGRIVRWHDLGTDPDDDPVVFDRLEDETGWTDATISPDGRWLVVHVEYGWTRVDVHLIDRTTNRTTDVITGTDAITWARVAGDHLYATTTLDAPRGRVVRAPLTDPTAWDTVVPETDAVIEGIAIAGRTLLVATGVHAASRLHRYALDGADRQEIALPELGSLAGVDADPAGHAPERAFLSFTSFTRPAGLWRWTPGQPLEPWSSFEHAGFDPSAYVVEQVRYPSTDGTEIPMFLVRAAATSVDESTPTVLSGYGGFAVSSSPAFGPGIVTMCDAGGVYAVACIRGGNEYGEEWHRAGMLADKQQVFDDFAAAAMWLVDNKRTSPGRLAIRGGSNGGLLVGAAITQRPDLCRAAVCAVPLLDMIRFHKFLLGALWVPEYGDPDRPEDFRWLYAYSPYHHVDEGVAYPATLLLTAEADSRVDPLHARKMAARLQAATAIGDLAPILLRVETRAGHGAGKPVTKQADELADTWAFVLWQLGADRAFSA